MRRITKILTASILAVSLFSGSVLSAFPAVAVEKTYTTKDLFSKILPDRNTSEPVTIINSSIPTTKPEPQLHGFGLANIRLILEKYSGEYTMFYENGWFQFTADIPFTPIS